MKINEKKIASLEIDDEILNLKHKWEVKRSNNDKIITEGYKSKLY